VQVHATWEMCTEKLAKLLKIVNMNSLNLTR